MIEVCVRKYLPVKFYFQKARFNQFLSAHWIRTANMTTFGMVIPGNIGFSGTLSAPLFVTNQRIVAPYKTGTTSTISVGSMAGTFSSITQAYAATLTVGTILNIMAGGSLGTSFAPGTVNYTTGSISTLTVGSMSSTGASFTSLSTSFGTISTISAALANIATITGLTINLSGSNVVNFGSDQITAASSGIIGYQVATSGALDIYGAGVNIGSRSAKIWDNLLVPGSLTSAWANIGTVAATSATYANIYGSSLAITGSASVSNMIVGNAYGIGPGSNIAIGTVTGGQSIAYVGGFTMSASNNYPSSSYYASNAFVNDTTYWAPGTYLYSVSGSYTGTTKTGTVSGEYLQVKTPAPYLLQSYYLTGNGSTHLLSQFAIMASSDGTNWTMIDIRLNANCLTKQFFIPPPNNVAFNIYRLVVIQDPTGDSNYWCAVSYFGPIFGLAATMQLDVVGQSRITGNMAVTGAMAKSSGTFQVPHPIRDGFDLVHSFIEGPRCDLIYRGRIALRKGKAKVDIERECSEAAPMTPGTFEALCQNPQGFVSNNESWDSVHAIVSKNLLNIYCDNPMSRVTVDWIVIAERKDQVIQKWDKTDDFGKLITEHVSNR